MTANRQAFDIPFTRVLGPDGGLIGALPAFADSRAAVAGLYRQMVLTRTFDAKAVALQRTGRLGTYASSLGQEAIAVGVGDAMYEDDILLPTFREHGAQIRRGVSLVELLLYWGGDERGSDFAGPREDFPVSITVGGHAPHAAGTALACKLRGEHRASVCMFGDGASSKGDVYEAMNIAGVWQLPVVFVISNNQWAISVPRERQTAAATLAQKAFAAGFGGEQVDGNDVLAVRDVVRRAVDAARADYRPHLIECLTYRLADHTTVDDATRYRSDTAVSEQWRNDPIARVRRYLTSAHGWQREDEQAVIRECHALVEAAAEAYLQAPPQPPESMFDFLYAELPESLRAQRDAVVARATGGDRDA
jgi:pyruvate dehydrogenase E1 component alpha subunit